MMISSKSGLFLILSRTHQSSPVVQQIRDLAFSLQWRVDAVAQVQSRVWELPCHGCAPSPKKNFIGVRLFKKIYWTLFQTVQII